MGGNKESEREKMKWQERIKKRKDEKKIFLRKVKKKKNNQKDLKGEKNPLHKMKIA